jgi:hypothetical protein
MRICILTLATPEINAYSGLGIINKLAYATRHSYDFYYYNHSRDLARAPAWSKILILQRHLPQYDWVFWSDADSLVMNQSIRLESLTSKYASQDMSLTAGPNDKYNTGQWLIRRCGWCSRILDDTWNIGPTNETWLKQNPWEQSAFIYLINTSRADEHRIACAPMRSLNSRPSASYLDMFEAMTDLEYMPGDFIVHFYHTKQFSLRVEGMTHYFTEWLKSEGNLDLFRGAIDVDRFDGGYKRAGAPPPARD